MDTTFVLYFVVPVILGVIILLAGGIFLTIDARRKKKDGQVDIYDWDSTGGKINSVKLDKHETQREDTKGVHIDIAMNLSLSMPTQSMMSSIAATRFLPKNMLISAKKTRKRYSTNILSIPMSR